MHLSTGSVRARVISAVIGLAAVLPGGMACASPEAAVPGPIPTPMAVAEPAAAASVTTVAPPISRAGRRRRPALAGRRGLMINQITAAARRMQGVPYVFGGTSPRGFDCSGFTMRMFSYAGIHLQRMADEQFAQGRRVAVPEPGDLVFFSTYLPGASHVGISLGGRRFIHAACHRGVTESSLDEAYYRSRYIGARRIF